MSAIAESDSDSEISTGTGTTGTDDNESLRWNTVDERAFEEVGYMRNNVTVVRWRQVVIVACISETFAFILVLKANYVTIN